MHAVEAIAISIAAAPRPAAARAAIHAAHVTRRFGRRTALADVSLSVAPGEIHALLGPNGAGKTTLLRILGGLMSPDSGSVVVLGADAAKSTRAQRAAVGVVPSGDRSFYLRISGFENLLFFGRLHGFRRQEARERAHEVLGAVDLDDAAHIRVGEYSHGMQKRLSFARALLARPRALLVDEATHDLDPHAARVVRALTREIAGEGTAVVWATQRLEEIRDFAQTATLLRAGEVRYAGSVERLAADVRVRRHAVRVRTQSPLEPAALATHVRQALGAAADVELAGSDADLLLLDLHERESIGSALTRLAAAGIDVVACREVQSEIEEAFVRLTGDDA
jgi:ABC-2 type transport system ATP-binding protein